MNYLDEYRKRGYVRAINWGFILIGVGIFVPIVTLIGGAIGLSASIRHLVDSARRIRLLEETLAGLRPASG